MGLDVSHHGVQLPHARPATVASPCPGSEASCGGNRLKIYALRYGAEVEISARPFNDFPLSMSWKGCEAGYTATGAVHARGVCSGKANVPHGSAETAAYVPHFTVIRSAIVHKTSHSHSDATAQTTEGHVVRLALRSLRSPDAGVHLHGYDRSCLSRDADALLSF